MRTWTPFFRILAALLLAALPSARAHGDEGEAARFAGRWVVGYRDALLGWVEGNARVAADERTCTVTLRHGATQETTRLESTSIERTPSGVRIMLSGPSPRARHAPWVGPARAVDVARGTTSLRLRLGTTLQDVPIAAPAPVAPDRLELELHFSWNGALSGTWMQRARADTAVDDQGGGRAGTIELTRDGTGQAVVTGPETWHRPTARIHHVVVVQDQRSHAMDGPAWPYPLDERGKETGTALIDRTRTLLVLGEDFPTERADPVELRAIGKTMEYHVRAVQQDFEETSHYQWEKDRAFEKLAKYLTPVQLAAAQKMDAMLVRARALPGVLPGRHGFTLDGAEGVWILEYGDFTAELRTLRVTDDSGNAEPTRYVFDPETVVFEVEADRDLPFVRIPLIVARNGTPLVFGGERQVWASPVQGRPRLYRTAPFLVTGRQAETAPGTIAVASGDRLTAVVAEVGWVSTRAGEAGVTVVSDPRDVARTLRVGTDSLDWPAALAVAARCAGLPFMDVANLKREDARRKPAFIVFTTGDRFREIDVLVGEHAGMLLLRQGFVERMREAERELHTVLRNRGLLEGLQRSLEAQAKVLLNHPLTRMKVTLPNGAKDTYLAALLPTYLEQRHGLAGPEREAWAREATSKALAQYLIAIVSAREQAQQIDACDVEGLLELTGIGFEPIVAECTQRLVRRKDGAVEGAWEIDTGARPWIQGIQALAQKVREQEARVKLDRTVLVVAASLLTAGVAGLYGGGWALLELAVDGADLGWAIYDEVSTQHSEAREVRLAAGAAVLIGGRRYEEALARDRYWIASAFPLLYSAAGVAFGQWAELPTLGELAAAVRGRELVRRLPLVPATGPQREAARATLARLVTELAEQDQVDLANGLLQAREVRRVAGAAALDASEARLVALADALEETWKLDGARKPLWADRLDDSLLGRVRPLLGEGAPRRDIPTLFMEDAVRMGRLLHEAQGLSLLRGAGYLEVDELARAIQQAQGRVRTGTMEHLRSTAPEAGTPPGLRVYGDTNLMPRPGGGQDLTLDVYFGARRDPIAEVKCGRGTNELGGPGEMLVLDTAVLFKRTDELAEGFVPVGELGAIRAPGAPTSTVPAFVRTGVDMVPGRGTPLIIYLTLRALNDLGIGFGDPAIRLVKLQCVLNVETTVQLGWLRATYPTADPGELFRYTDIYRYAESVLEQAGIGVREVELRISESFRARPAHKADPKNVFFSGKDPPDRFLQRYPFPPGVEDVPEGFDVYLHVQPK